MRRYALICLLTLGCSSQQPATVPEATQETSVAPNTERAKPGTKDLRMMVIPDREYIPEKSRGKRVHALGETVKVGELQYILNACEKTETGAKLEYRVTNYRTMPALVSPPIMVSFDEDGTLLFACSEPEANEPKPLNPRVSRKLSVSFELPDDGRFVIAVANEVEDQTITESAFYACPFGKPAWVYADIGTEQ